MRKAKMDMEAFKIEEDIEIYKNMDIGRLYREEGRTDLSINEFEKILTNVSPESDPFFYNMVLNEIEIAKGNKILESMPRGLGITLTNKCNIRCIMCSVWKSPWDMPEKTVKEIVNLFPYLQRIFWQGGEVFISPYFKELFEKITSFPNIRQHINTNGLLINKDWAMKLVKANVNIILSIDGVTKKTYEYIRSGAKFEDLLRGIELLNEYKALAKQDRVLAGRKCTIVINLVVMKSNYKELDQFIDFAKKYRFERLQITPVDINNRENIFLYKDNEALNHIDKILPGFLEKAKAYGIKISNWLPGGQNPTCCQADVSSPQKDHKIDQSLTKYYSTDINNRLSCYWPWQFLFIDWGGKVRPQCFCSKEVGNIYNNTVQEIWNNEVMQLYRQRLFQNDVSGFCCSRCVSGVVAKEHLGFKWSE